MVRINFVAEDTLRDLIYKSVNGYCSMIERFCPTSVEGKDCINFILLFTFIVYLIAFIFVVNLIIH